MADPQPLSAFGYSGGVTANGQTAPFQLSPSPRVVQLVSSAASVAAAGSVQVTLQIGNGGDLTVAAGWTPVITLGAQSTAGTSTATAQVPAGLTGTARLQWTVVGNGAQIAAFAAGIG